MALYVTVCVGVVRQRQSCSEEVVSAVVHSLKTGLVSDCADLKAASYMILSQLCVTVTLSTTVVDRLVSRLAKVNIAAVCHVCHVVRTDRKRQSVGLNSRL